MTRVRFFCAFASFFLISATAFGQATSSLRGTVTDSQGAIIPGAALELVGDQTGFKRSVLSDEMGVYQFLQVPPGTYSLVAQMAGFAVVTNTGIQLLVDTPRRLDMKLQVATVAETVNVTAEAAGINTVDASIGNAFNQTQVRELPLQTRNVVELLSLQPGVTQTGEVLGSRRDQNNVILDGVDTNDNQNAGMNVLGRNTALALPGMNGNGTDRAAGFNAALPVPLDSVQEFRVTVAGEMADQGRSSGGQVTLVTKSGTNRLHGSAYEYNRNTIFSANDWFNNQAGVSRQPLNRNQFGFSTGGPMKKDRAFFFFNYERRTDRSATTQLEHVPSAQMRSGILQFANSDGAITSLTPAQLQQIDPLHIGVSPQILSLLQQYPVGNDPAAGYDSGLNFVGFRFNAPQNLTYNSSVGKMDFHLDSAGKHTIAVRGTLAANNETLTPQSFPGQPINNVKLNNSRGISALYTGVLSSTVVNVASFGLTRIGYSQTGPTGTAFTLDSIDPFQNYTTRGFTRIAPTYNFNDDVTWTKQAHTVTAGMNFRFVRNGITNYTNAWPTYAFGRGSLTGLGSDWVGDVQTYVNSIGGDSSMQNIQAVTRAAGDLFGLIASGTMNYAYDKSGTALPIGTPTARNFATNEYAFYIGDSWRPKRYLTLTGGLRYENNTPPWETNGLQVAPTIPLQNYWAARVGGAAAGIPSYLATPAESYALVGPANGQPSWFARQNDLFSPHLAFAYSPQGKGLGSKILGNSGVFRGGATMAYDRFGSDMVVQFDNNNSFGLTENDILGSFNFTTANRLSSTGALPALPAASQHTFPFTPPNVAAVCCTYMGISSDLKTPYAYVVNASVARPIPGGLTIEAGYQGRFSHSLLMERDEGGVNWDFTDPNVGSLAQHQKSMRNVYLALSGNNINRTAAVSTEVAANPSMVPTNPFTEKYFANFTNLYFPGSASANFLYLLMSNGMSDTDTLNQSDRLKVVNGKSFPNCGSAPGCWTFYAPQQSSLNVWNNTGTGSFNSATLTIRRPMSKGLSFDFNYTLSHSIDRGGGAESGYGAYGGIMLNPYDNKSFRGSSDFDARHYINANILYQLPFGKGKPLLANASSLLDTLVGGWQLSTISRYRSGLPSAVFYNGLWPTNFSFGAVSYPINPNFSVSNGLDENKIPSVFSNTLSAASNWLPMYAGTVGTRAAVRLAGMTNFDLAIAKSFPMPFEGQRIQFRAEAFNAFNHANFNNPNLDASSPSTFGEYTQDVGPRVMQFALRYEF